MATNRRRHATRRIALLCAAWCRRLAIRLARTRGAAPVTIPPLDVECSRRDAIGGQMDSLTYEAIRQPVIGVHLPFFTIFESFRWSETHPGV